MHEDGLLESEQFMQTLTKHGQIAFPEGPNDGYTNANRKFIGWAKIIHGERKDSTVAGERNQDGEWDGRVAFIARHGFILGHYKKGLRHG